MQFKTNKSLYDLISALAGTSDFTSSERAFLLSMANRRFYEAYQATDIWPRYITVGEQRAISSSVVPYTEGALDEIANFIRIHRLEPFLRNSTIEFDYWVDGDGAHVENLVTTDATSVYVTYKKTLTELTTLDYDGELGTQLVPIEFFYFIAHATYADFLRMDGQTQKAMLESEVAKTYLDTELEKAETVMNINALKTRINTHLNRQSR
jgi:hypothetical protein|tara:strand:- start:620 stop:1246 length:627 start_codon:yes stop_codon:yes gene_type:complete